MKDFKLLSEDERYFIAINKGDKLCMRYCFSKATGQVSILVEDIMDALGKNHIDLFWESDTFLDHINFCRKDNPGRQIFGDYESGAMFLYTSHPTIKQQIINY